MMLSHTITDPLATVPILAKTIIFSLLHVLINYDRLFHSYSM